MASYWIDTLVLKTKGNTYAALLHHPFLFKGKPTQCSRGSTHRITRQPTALEHVWYSGKWPRAARISSPRIPQNNTPPEDDDPKVLTVFETFASNNRRKRALRRLTDVCQIAAINPWNDTAINFNAGDEPKYRTVRAPAALVLSPIVDGFRHTKVLMDSDSGLNLIYEDTLHKMEIDRSRIEQSSTTFRGIIPSREARCVWEK